MLAEGATAPETFRQKDCKHHKNLESSHSYRGRYIDVLTEGEGHIQALKVIESRSKLSGTRDRWGMI